MKEIAQSHSKLNTYDTCPNKYKLIYVDKSYKEDSDNPYFIKGQKLHKQLENYVVSKLADEPEMAKGMSLASRNAIPIVNSLMKRFPDYYPEQKICVDKNYKKLTWFSKSAYYRAIIDFLAMNKVEAVLLDYKSGKVREYEGFGGQLHLSGFLMMMLYPNLKRVTSSYLYLEHKQTTSITIVRSGVQELKNHFENKYIQINSDTEFKPIRNQYCLYCNATPNQCKFKRIKEL